MSAAPSGAARIVEAARSLIASESRAHLPSLRAIARAAGYSPAGLYAHFPNRDAILAAVAARLEEDLAEILRRAISAAHPLQALGHAYLTFARYRPAEFLFLTHQARPDTPRLALKVIAEVIDDCVASGELMVGPGFDVEEIAATCWASIHGFALLHRRAPDVIGAPLLTESLQRLLVGLRA